MESLEQAVRHSVPKPLALVLNYPSNPTAEVVDLEFYEKVRGLCPQAPDLGTVRPGLFGNLFR